jgi:hypothetical protein
MKIITRYMERYLSRRKAVIQDVALATVQDASVIYLVEQGEIEIPSLDHQRRVVVTLRCERIVK